MAQIENINDHQRLRKPKSEVYYAYNVTRQAFLNLGVKVADTTLSRLRGLLGKVRLRPNEALWVFPSRGVHTIGLLFSIDLIYLDSERRVVGLVESLGPFRIAPFRWQAASVLELPPRTIYESGTQPGDQLLICTPEEMEAYWARERGEPEKPAIPIVPIKQAM